MARQIADAYIPMTVEHDLRYPPIGRDVAAQVVQLEDGEHALQVTSEVFEEGDSLDALAGDGRRMVVRSESPHTVAAYYDRGFRGPEADRLLGELSGLSPLGPTPAEYGKKSLEPVPTLVILTGIFVFGSIGKGFFAKLGADVYERLRDSLAAYCRRRHTREEVLDLCFCATRKGEPLEVHVLVTQPSPRDIQGLFSAALQQIDALLGALPLEDHDVARIVVQYEGEALAVRYVVRGDCVPLPLTRSPGETTGAG